MPRKSSVVLLLFVLLAAGPSPAETVTVLTQQQVKSFLAVWSELEALAAGSTKKEGAVRLPSADRGNPFSQLMKDIENNESHSQFIDIIEKNGYANIQDWGAVADQIMQAYMAVRMDRMYPQLEAEVASLRRKVEENPSLSAREKQALIEELQSTLTVATQFQASEAEKAAVRPYMQTIDRIFR